MYPEPAVIDKDSILPDVAAVATVLSVATETKSVVPYFEKSDAVILYIYFRTYPPIAKGEVDSDVGSEPEYAVPPLLSKTLYIL